MVKMFKDKSVYMGEMHNGKRHGKGTLYVLGDFFEGFKISGTWVEDKVEGIAKFSTRNYIEQGNYIAGKKHGKFIRVYSDGRSEEIEYNNNIFCGKKILDKKNDKKSTEFGAIKLVNGNYYLGDVHMGKPFGFGMIYHTENTPEIVDSMFCEVSNDIIVRKFEFPNNNEEFAKTTFMAEK